MPREIVLYYLYLWVDGGHSSTIRLLVSTRSVHNNVQHRYCVQCANRSCGFWYEFSMPWWQLSYGSTSTVHHPRHPHSHPSTIPSERLSHQTHRLIDHFPIAIVVIPLSFSWLLRLPYSSHLSCKPCGSHSTNGSIFLPIDYEISKIQPSYQNNCCIMVSSVYLPRYPLFTRIWPSMTVGMYCKQTAA